MDRRKFTRTLLQGVSSYALLDTLFLHQAWGKSLAPLAKHWAVQLDEYCQDLKKQSISLKEWQAQVESLYHQVDLADILTFIDFDRLQKGFTYPDLGVATRKVQFPQIQDLPPNTAFFKKIFGMQKDRAIIPHGHSNMVSAHLILKGTMHLRNYDRLAMEDKHMIIRPTVDKMIRPGASSSISDDKNNVHWFIASSPTAFTFDVIMTDLEEKPYDIHNLDIDKKEKRGDGSLRVPLMEVQAALAKYGKESHHD